MPWLSALPKYESDDDTILEIRIPPLPECECLGRTRRTIGWAILGCGLIVAVGGALYYAFCPKAKGRRGQAKVKMELEEDEAFLREEENAMNDIENALKDGERKVLNGEE